MARYHAFGVLPHTAPTTTPKVATPYIKISARRRRIERALQLLQPISPDGAFGQNVGRVGTPKMGRVKGVKLFRCLLVVGRPRKNTCALAAPLLFMLECVFGAPLRMLCSGHRHGDAVSSTRLDLRLIHFLCL